MTHYGKSSISIFQEIFAGTDKILILGGVLSTDNNYMKNWDFPDIS